MNLPFLRKAVHQTRYFDPLVVKTAHELVELFLRCDNEPELPAPADAEVLNDRLQVQHFLNIASDELSDFVDNKDQRLSRPSAFHQLTGSFGEFGRRHVRLVLDCPDPRIGHRPSSRVEAVQDTAGFAQRKRDLPFLGGPILVEQAPVFFLEALELSLFLQGNFEFREVQVLGVTEALEEEPIHDLGQASIAATYPTVA
jgi:hypothetical protein